MNRWPFFEIQRHPQEGTATLYLNRPQARNAMNWDFWRDLPHVVGELEEDAQVRAVILAAHGKSFSTGLDLQQFLGGEHDLFNGGEAEGREALHRRLLLMQEGFNRIANSQKIYIAVVHRHCIGGGLDLIAACDLRLASQDAKVSLREAKVAIVADMGSLNRLPAIIGMGNTKMMALTGGDFSAAECERMGLFNALYPDREKAHEAAGKLAAEIAANPSIAVRGAKQVLNYIQSHSQADSLAHVALWNAAFLQSAELKELQQRFAPPLSKKQKT